MPKAALIALLALLANAGGCDPGLSHRCTSSAACVRGAEQGICQPTGRCSFADLSCSSGQRYSEWAGELENQCVMAGEPDGSPPDGSPLDGSSPDGSPADAPAPDASAPDAPLPDAPAPDTPPPDAAAPDAPPPDAPEPDAP